MMSKEIWAKNAFFEVIPFPRILIFSRRYGQNKFFLKVKFKICYFSPDIDICRNMGKKRYFLSDLKEMLSFLEMFIFTEIWVENDIFKVLISGELWPKNDFFIVITKNFDFLK